MMRSLAPLPSRQVGPGAFPRLGHALLATKNAVRGGSGKVRGENPEEWSGMFAADSRRRVWPNGAEVDNQNSLVWMPNAFSGAQPALADEELPGLDDQERPYFRYPTAAAQKAIAAAQEGTAAAGGTLAGAPAAGTNAESFAMIRARESTPAHFAIRHSPVASDAAPAGAAAAEGSRYNPDALRILSETLAPQNSLSGSPTASLSLIPASNNPSAEANVVSRDGAGSPGLPGSPEENAIGKSAELSGSSRVGRDATLGGLLPPRMTALRLTWSWEEWILGLGIGAAAIGFAMALVTSATGGRLGLGRNMSAVVAPGGRAVSGVVLNEAAAASGSVLSGDLLAGGDAAAAPVMVLGEEQMVGVGETGKKVPFYLREAKPGVIELSAATLPHVLRLRPTLVMFYAPWCPYCQRMEAAWAALAEKLHQESFNVQVARVDAYRYPELTDKYKIPGFPTLMLFNGERPVATHRGRRNLEALFSFVEKHF